MKKMFLQQLSEQFSRRKSAMYNLHTSGLGWCGYSVPIGMPFVRKGDSVLSAMSCALWRVLCAHTVRVRVRISHADRWSGMALRTALAAQVSRRPWPPN